jgi:hypothetical protein
MLEGSLETFPLASVVRLIDDAGRTGKLSVHAPLGQGSMVFEGGRLVDATGPGPDPVEAALALFDHSNGTFTFRIEDVGQHRLDLEIRELLDLVADRASAWAEIRAAVPMDGPLVVLPLEASDRIDGDVTISSEGWRVAVLANGRTTAQVASLAGLSEFRACSVLLELVQAGLIGLNAHAPRTASASAPVAKHSAPEPSASDDASDEPAPDDADVDPTDLLRELGESESDHPASRRKLSRR